MTSVTRSGLTPKLVADKNPRIDHCQSAAVHRAALLRFRLRRAAFIRGLDCQSMDALNPLNLVGTLGARDSWRRFPTGFKATWIRELRAACERFVLRYLRFLLCCDSQSPAPLVAALPSRVRSGFNGLFHGQSFDFRSYRYAASSNRFSFSPVLTAYLAPFQIAAAP